MSNRASIAQMRTHRKFVATYIMASRRNGTLYTGVTADLPARVWKHPVGTFEGFSKRHGCTRLVWFEPRAWIIDAIRREKQVKGWKRDRKLKLIEDKNPEWRDLAAEWFPENDPNWAPAEEPD